MLLQSCLQVRLLRLQKDRLLLLREACRSCGAALLLGRADLIRLYHERSLQRALALLPGRVQFRGAWRGGLLSSIALERCRCICTGTGHQSSAALQLRRVKLIRLPREPGLQRALALQPGRALLLILLQPSLPARIEGDLDDPLGLHLPVLHPHGLQCRGVCRRGPGLAARRCRLCLPDELRPGRLRGTTGARLGALAVGARGLLAAALPGPDALRAPFLQDVHRRSELGVRRVVQRRVAVLVLGLQQVLLRVDEAAHRVVEASVGGQVQGRLLLGVHDIHVRAPGNEELANLPRGREEQWRLLVTVTDVDVGACV